MLPINIYALTRVEDSENVKRLERQMSKRGSFLKVKEWELQSLRLFQKRLEDEMEEACNLCFFYSFVLPKLGKEFDLLRISEHSVVNVELKSGHISDEAVKKQLLQNRYYLSSLGKEIHSYTYISEDDRLVKLTKGNKIADASFEQLILNLRQQDHLYQEDIEELFKEEQFLISPLSDPEQFLRGEYFLTSQQFDIKRRIRRCIAENPGCFQGFTGLPGTGKSILLYDLAMELSKKKKICLLHFGSKAESIKLLDARMKRVDVLYCRKEDVICFKEKYGAVLVDEGHWMTKAQVDEIRRYVEQEKIPLILAYDWEEALAKEERIASNIDAIECLPGYIRYQLTNRIRVNQEISSFVYHVMAGGRIHYRSSYPSVQLCYANTKEEAVNLLNYFKIRGYQYIYDPRLSLQGNICGVDVETAKCLEYDSVVMLVDDAFVYDEQGYLRTKFWKADDGQVSEKSYSAVRNLYHGLNRAKKKVAVVVLDNSEVFARFLFTVQNERDKKKV